MLSDDDEDSYCSTLTRLEARKRKVARGKGNEARRVSNRLGNFRPEDCSAWAAIRERFSSGITHGELRSVAQLVSLRTGIGLDRDAGRDNRVLIKWFDENWEKAGPIVAMIKIYDREKAGPIVAMIKIYDREFRPITGEREDEINDM
ncbi:hypothetical protein TRFO_42035 [Tritrichomonas foetus]|uniref:Uncharacterized protein n=1 Tax=Tritrichomonas foetus TaxID=1144522 RepID=A0A1J4KY26_9EUKA|nr:hypothetical protein TRFO_42035 [Tritrichomonas foetus]|eukprot:OHT16153.1 hypothetical protein TRFO_42035 [Tritrichomonas foetus]